MHSNRVSGVTVVRVRERVERRMQSKQEAILISFKSWLSAVMGGKRIVFFCKKISTQNKFAMTRFGGTKPVHGEFREWSMIWHEEEVGKH
ncbi:hypothetical protein [Paenibacillus sp. AD87]|uniref:hypothetical protein n=1 Tax=Paenibacillus sp. AD87 TaxID=1528787 RepID=UPI0007FF46AD|nr:hypothetical protein [Paenibacillus sp. AD87]OAX46211.1 hypothetical protein gpAD87_27315 [Paenibacillus sp. AD87]